PHVPCTRTDRTTPPRTRVGASPFPEPVLAWLGLRSISPPLGHPRRPILKAWRSRYVSLEGRLSQTGLLRLQAGFVRHAPLLSAALEAIEPSCDSLAGSAR